MSSLFKPFRIGSMEIRNRFMRSATTSAWADEKGVVRSEIVELYRELARGGVGLIVKGHLYVAEKGKAHVGMAGIDSDGQLPMLRKLTEGVHREGGKIVAQLNHGGILSGVDRAGPSEMQGNGWNARELSLHEIEEVVRAFADAAERVVRAGFDGIQIHGAHGYLISQFLSPVINRRRDEWGGSLENRMRLLTEVYLTIRDRVGWSIPILLKMNCDDFVSGGFSIQESPLVASAMCEKGLDAIEISGGGLGRPGDRDKTAVLETLARSSHPALREASYAGYALRIRMAIPSTPLALVNGIRSRRCMESVLEQGVADVISMSRPFIREPHLVKNLMTGQLSAACTSCGQCESSEVFSKTMIRCSLPSQQ